jgi:hypothetical protein
MVQLFLARYSEPVRICDYYVTAAVPKSINEEVCFLLKMHGNLGEVIRNTSAKEEATQTGSWKADRESLRFRRNAKPQRNAKMSRSLHMYPAFMLAYDAGLRDTEIKTLKWAVSISGLKLSR